ncbi:MAG TPA: PDZ domain-containing protein, partial [Candidatus Woesebacteria bacterium]|nr:PDZ domain-containing protein [Candidatus Woesebacteria bacterium]
MKLKPKSLTNILLYLSIAIFLFGSGYKLAEWNLKKNARQQYAYTVFNANNPDFFKNRDTKNLDFNLFWDTWEKVEQKYIDESKIDQQKMFYGAIKGMVASIGDPYTFFLTPDENKQSKDDLGGKFEGIGAQLGLRDNRVVVIAPIKNSPAEAAGIKAGDYIIKVDGESTQTWTLTQTVSKIRGEKGTTVTLTLANANGQRDVSITRDQIKVDSVEL